MGLRPLGLRAGSEVLIGDSGLDSGAGTWTASGETGDLGGSLAGTRTASGDGELDSCAGVRNLELRAGTGLNLGAGTGLDLGANSECLLGPSWLDHIGQKKCSGRYIDIHIHIYSHAELDTIYVKK